MHPCLASLEADLSSAVHGLTTDQLVQQVDGKWSIAQVLEHLYLTYTGTVKGLQRCLEGGQPLATSPSFYHRFATFVVTRLNYFPAGRKSPKQAAPRGISVDHVLADLGPQLIEMDRLASACEARFGSKVRVLDHPVLGPLTIEQWRKFHLLHGRHHCAQILERRRALE